MKGRNLEKGQKAKDGVLLRIKGYLIIVYLKQMHLWY